MDYAKSGDLEIGMVIKRREWVEGTDIGYRISEIGVGTGSNTTSEMKSEHYYICDCYMLMHISTNGGFLAPKHLLGHSGDLGICTRMANTNTSSCLKVMFSVSHNIGLQ